MQREQSPGQLDLSAASAAAERRRAAAALGPAPAAPALAPGQYIGPRVILDARPPRRPSDSEYVAWLAAEETAAAGRASDAVRLLTAARRALPGGPASKEQHSVSLLLAQEMLAAGGDAAAAQALLTEVAGGRTPCVHLSAAFCIQPSPA